MRKVREKKFDTEKGSVSILVIILVVMAISLCYAIVGVAETLIAKKEALYGIQSSANAAAFAYGQTIVNSLDECVAEQMEEAGGEGDESEAAEADESEAENSSEDELVAACMEDEEIKEKAMEAAESSADTIADKYHLEHVHLSLTEDTMNLAADQKVESKVPVFGSSGKLSVQAKSSFQITKKDPEEDE